MLSKQAFNGLSLHQDQDDQDVYDSPGEAQAETSSNHDDDELDISKSSLPQRLIDSLLKRGIIHLFPIQRAVFIPALKGQDIIARAKTGIGKTLSFGIPTHKRLTQDATQHTSRGRMFGRLPRVLVLAPTRELAKQVKKR